MKNFLNSYKKGTYVTVVYQSEEKLKKEGRGKDAIQEAVVKTASSVVRLEIPSYAMAMIKNRLANPNAELKETAPKYEAVYEDGVKTPFLKLISTGELYLPYQSSFNKRHAGKKSFTFKGETIDINTLNERRYANNKDCFVIKNIDGSPCDIMENFDNYEAAKEYLNTINIEGNMCVRKKGQYIIDAKKGFKVPYEIYSVVFDTKEEAEYARKLLPNGDHFEVKYNTSSFMVFKLSNILKIFNKNEVFYEKGSEINV